MIDKLIPTTIENGLGDKPGLKKCDFVKDDPFQNISAKSVAAVKYVNCITAEG